MPLISSHSMQHHLMPIKGCILRDSLLTGRLQSFHIGKSRKFSTAKKCHKTPTTRIRIRIPTQIQAATTITTTTMLLANLQKCGRKWEELFMIRRLRLNTLVAMFLERYTNYTSNNFISHQPQITSEPKKKHMRFWTLTSRFSLLDNYSCSHDYDYGLLCISTTSLFLKNTWKFVLN